MIPLFVCEAAGARVLSLDDPSVVKDACALDGTGGTSVVPTFTVNQLRDGPDLGWSKLRRVAQNVDHADACTLVLTPIVDGRQSGNAITRSLAVGAVGVATFPCNESGTGHAYRIDLTSYTSPVQFSNADVFVLGKRVSRS
jgi:hypothetical protein